MKKISLKLLFIFSALAFNHYQIADLPNSRDAFDGDMDAFDDLLNNIDINQVNRQATDCVTASDVVDALVELNAPAALQTDIYRVTYDLNSRSILRLPANKDYFDRTCTRGFNVKLFFNQTPQMFFTAHSPFIKSYLNIEHPDFLDEIDLGALGIEGIPQVFPLFSNIKLEERRLGLMGSFHKKFETTSLTIVLPFYWSEHNFFLTDDEISAIEGEPLFAEAGAGNDQSDAEAFFLKHLVSTKLGFGDLKVDFEGVAYQDECTELVLGLQAIIPTAHAFDGCSLRVWIGDSVLFGGQFCKCAPVPPLDFLELFKLKLCCPTEFTKECDAEAATLVTNFLVGALDRLTANVADRYMGQRHLSLGPIANFTYNFTPSFSVVGYGAVEYFFPRNETRFFLARVPASDFVRDYTNPEFAQENLNFLNTQLVNTLYPASACVKVHPGVNLEFSGALAYDSVGVHFEAGYDFWFQGNENITVTRQQQRTLNILKGIKPWACQNKLFLKIIGNCDDWHLGLLTDYTFKSRGIGKDFTITANYTIDF